MVIHFLKFLYFIFSLYHSFFISYFLYIFFISCFLYIIFSLYHIFFISHFRYIQIYYKNLCFINVYLSMVHIFDTIFKNSWSHLSLTQNLNCSKPCLTQFFMTRGELSFNVYSYDISPRFHRLR